MKLELTENIFKKGGNAATPTTTEATSTLPWKREEEIGSEGVIQQTEFPSWANNKVMPTIVSFYFYLN